MHGSPAWWVYWHKKKQKAIPTTHSWPRTSFWHTSAEVLRTEKKGKNCFSFFFSKKDWAFSIQFEMRRSDTKDASFRFLFGKFSVCFQARRLSWWCSVCKAFSPVHHRLQKTSHFLRHLPKRKQNDNLPPMRLSKVQESFLRLTKRKNVLFAFIQTLSTRFPFVES